jgi:DNA-binding NarL/FixJ family response regulator
MKSIRVLLVDDQRSVRNGLTMRLELEPDLTVVGEAEDGASALLAAESLRPDVVVMDYEMPGMNGLEATRALTAAGIDCAVVMLSLHDDAAVKAAAARVGAQAFVAKHEPDASLLAAIRNVAPAKPGEEDRE